jgi:hypothetical protein
MQHFVQSPKLPFLIGNIIVEAYPPLNKSTKLASNDSNVWAWTKVLSTSLHL